MSENSTKCSNCGEPLDPTMDKCPKCGSGDREITVEDEGKGQDAVSVARSLVLGYSELAETFDAEQKTIANTSGVTSSMGEIEGITELLKEQRENAKEDAKRQRRYFYVSTAIAVVAIIVAIITHYL